MKNLKYLIVGIVFGVTLTKGEAISWYRIQEMLRFESFHMYGIFMTAVSIGALSIFLIKKFKLKTSEHQHIELPTKKYHHGIIFGGLIFGFGWALTGACPAPLYALVGAGYFITLVTIASALLGVWVYALLLPYLPD